MYYPIIDFLKDALANFSTDMFFLSSVGIIVLLFALFLIFALKIYNARSFSCAYFSITAAAFITAVCAVYLVVETPFQVFAFYFSITAAETVFFTLLLKFATTRKMDRSEEKELIKYIDKEIEKSGAKDKKPDEEINETIKCKTPADNPPKNELNFSHVKSVLERLDYFDLSPADKKQAELLKDALFSAERQGFTAETKGKINDGLSNLLKIMSKYGV